VTIQQQNRKQVEGCNSPHNLIMENVNARIFMG